MKRRLNNIFARDKKTFILAMDHGAGLNVLPDLNDTARVIRAGVENGVDAILTTFGIATTYQDAIDRAGLILRIDGGTSQLGSGKATRNVYSVEDALRTGADGVICMGYPGSVFEDISLSSLTENAAQAYKWNMPLVAEMLPAGFEDMTKWTPDNIGLACRVGAENGADIIKTQYTGSIDSFKKVTEGCYKPVVILGGGNIGGEEGLLQTVYDSLAAGGAGVAIGRSIWRHPNPGKLCKAIYRIIHDDATVEQAMLDLR